MTPKTKTLIVLAGLELSGLIAVCLFIRMLSDESGRILLGILWLGLAAFRLRKYLFE